MFSEANRGWRLTCAASILLAMTCLELVMASSLRAAFSTLPVSKSSPWETCCAFCMAAGDAPWPLGWTEKTHGCLKHTHTSLFVYSKAKGLWSFCLRILFPHLKPFISRQGSQASLSFQGNSTRGQSRLWINTRQLFSIEQISGPLETIRFLIWRISLPLLHTIIPSNMLTALHLNYSTKEARSENVI